MARRSLSVGGAALWFGACYVCAILGYLVINASAARLLTQQFGLFVVATTVSGLIGQIALFGVHRGGLRDAARLASHGDQKLVEMKRSVRAVSLVSLPFFSLGTAAVCLYVYRDAETVDRLTLAVGLALLVWLGGQQKLLANFLRGFGRVRLSSLLEGRSGGALVSLVQAGCITLVLKLWPSAGFPGSVVALVVGYAIPLLYGWYCINFMFEDSRSDSILRDLWSGARKNWHFASNLAAGFVNGVVEIWVAGFLLAASDLSLFSAAQRLSILIMVPLVSLGVVYSPVISRLAGKDNFQLERLLRTGATVAAVGTATVWIPTLIIPSEIMTAVYGPLFSKGSTLLVVLTVGGVSSILSGLCGTALTMSAHESIAGYSQWGAVFSRIALGSVLCLSFGVVGLAVSSTLINAALSLFMWRTARRKLGVWTHPTFKPDLRLLFRIKA